MALVRVGHEASSSNTRSYHVFLSFRGEDTRKTFTDNLHMALVKAGFCTFRDDDELPRGEDIKPELKKAIKQSRSSVVVFSKDYASSGWCLDELVMILERKTTSNHVVLPVFYDIDPSHVRKQTGSVAKAFARHEKKQSLDKLNRWRAALAEVADLAGMVLQNQADGLSDDDFPRDFGNLSSLKKLDLGYNAICRLPDCVRGLKGLDYLGVCWCTSLKSLIRLPRVRELDLFGCESLEKVTFQSLSCLPEKMLLLGINPLQIFEIEHWYKLEAIGRVDVEMINVLGFNFKDHWCKLEAIERAHVEMGLDEIISIDPIRTIRMKNPCSHKTVGIKGLYEYGIFSTFFPGTVNEVPGEFSHSSSGDSSISFIVPLLSNHSIRGLNIYCVYAVKDLWLGSEFGKSIIVRNKSKGLKWMYSPTCYGIPRDEQEEVIWFSHWKLGNQLEAGDQVTVSVHTWLKDFYEVKEWGIRIVLEEDDNDVNEEVIGIGGDLSELYQVMPGTYIFMGGPVKGNRKFPRLSVILNKIGEFDEEIDEEAGIEQAEPDRMLAAAEAEERGGISNLCGCKILVIHMFKSMVEFCQNTW